MRSSSPETPGDGNLKPASRAKQDVSAAESTDLKVHEGGRVESLGLQFKFEFFMPARTGGGHLMRIHGHEPANINSMTSLH